jgi:colanic acid biosynthesis protein WcaH
MQQFNRYLIGRKKFNYIRSFFTVFSAQLVINFGTKNKPKVLLLKRKEQPAKDMWWIPGGTVLKTEDSRDAALRIALRETGVECRIVKQLQNTREIFKNVQGIQDRIADYLSENFLLAPIDKSAGIRLDKTSSDYKFISKIEGDLHPFVKRHLRNSGLFKIL